MKKVGVIVVFTLLAVLAAVDLVRNFVTNDPVHYFARQPGRLLLVSAIAIVGGLAVLIFHRLSPRWQRGVKLFMLGSVASCLTVLTAFILHPLGRWLSHFGESDSLVTIIVEPLLFGVMAAFLWFQFYQVFKRRVI